MKLWMLKGLPASGKSTYAKMLAEDGWVRVNKDDMRAMLNNGKWSKNNEAFILKLRDFIISESLNSGKSVVVDDTNFAPKHADALRDLAKKHGAVFETKFLDVPLEECIKRDLVRPVSVGERVIRNMYNQFLAPVSQPYHPPEDKPLAVLCDIDGTLAHMHNRGPFEWDKVGNDILDDAVAGIVSQFRGIGHIILLSGRDSICRSETEEWLKRHGVEYDALYMRAEGDNRKDVVVKREMFNQHIRENYQVQYILDDRNQVVEMWRSLGLKCLQVAQGDF